MPDEKSIVVARVADSRDFQTRVRTLVTRRARQAQEVQNTPNKAAIIAAYLKITSTQHPQNIRRTCEAILAIPEFFTKVEDSTQGAEITDLELWPVIQANMLDYGELCE
jgi:hypothetical protein